MKRIRRSHPILFLLFASLALLFQQVFLTPQNKEKSPDILSSESIASSSSIAKVTRVIDGDTVVLSDGTKLRYIGIDSPETHAHECFASEAKKKNEELVLGKEIILKKDVSETDRYKRLLRYVYLPDGTFVNKRLVEEGYAYASSYPPDITFQEDLQNAQNQARHKKKGLWAGCPDAAQ
jgi:micrococcal nuclease